MSKNKIRMKRLFFVLLGVALYVQAEAQPARRRVKPNDADKAEKTVDRASLQFPVAVEVPEDVVWRRDVYRQLDLTLDKNAPVLSGGAFRRPDKPVYVSVRFIADGKDYGIPI